MISKLEAAEELERMSQLDFFPRGKDDKAAQKELVLAAQGAASREILSQVVSDWLLESTEAPKPADLTRLISSKRNALQVWEPEPERIPDCTLCDDTGLNDKAGDWKFCGCPFGVQLLQDKPEAADEANSAMERIARNVARSKGRRSVDVEEARKTLASVLGES